jgi:hypothetical protein
VSAKQWHVEAGEYKVFVGPSSGLTELTGQISLTDMMVGVGK